jgi:hypothetical protein
MTININVSVNGSYKVPVTTQYGDNEPVTEVISGRGHEGPFVKSIPYYHGSNPGNIVVVTVGPEEYDTGEVSEDVEAAA